MTPGTSTPTPVTPPGHPPEVWAPRLAGAPRLTLAQLCPELMASEAVELVVVSAHPDDETLGAGRLISSWVAAGGTVHAMLASDGEACLDQVIPRPPELAEVRLGEWHAALDTLGVRGSRHALHLTDGALANREDQITVALQGVLDDLHAAGVVVVAPWGDDPHPDHRAVGRAARRARAVTGCTHRWEYPVWMTYWSDPAAADAAHSELIVVEHSEGAETAFRAAAGCFASQLTPWRAELGAVVPPAMVEHQRRQLLFVPRLAPPLTTPAASRRAEGTTTQEIR